jgi:hypothetical protein
MMMMTMMMMRMMMMMRRRRRRRRRVMMMMIADEPEVVFIPAPDYDEEEKTMMLEEEDGDPDLYLDPAHRGQRVYREYQGEDFAQYLSDEDTPQMTQTLTARHRRFNMNGVERRAKTEAKRPHYKKRDSMLSPGGGHHHNHQHHKSGKKHGKEKDNRDGFSGSHSLRDFSFADSKFGTVNGRNKRHSLPQSLSSNHDLSAQEAEMFVETESSYEQFLHQRHGHAPTMGTLHEDALVDDLPFGQAAHGLPEAPPKYGRQNSKDGMWKKLTWKFKSRMQHSFDFGS